MDLHARVKCHVEKLFFYSWRNPREKNRRAARGIFPRTPSFCSDRTSRERFTWRKPLRLWLQMMKLREMGRRVGGDIARRLGYMSTKRRRRRRVVGTASSDVAPSMERSAFFPVRCQHCAGSSTCCAFLRGGRFQGHLAKQNVNRGAFSTNRPVLSFPPRE